MCSSCSCNKQTAHEETGCLVATIAASECAATACGVCSPQLGMRRDTVPSQPPPTCPYYNSKRKEYANVTQQSFLKSNLEQKSPGA